MPQEVLAQLRRQFVLTIFDPFKLAICDTLPQNCSNLMPFEKGCLILASFVPSFSLRLKLFG